MKEVDRSDYTSGLDNPYNDAPEEIGYGQTISSPHMHAYALEVSYLNLLFVRNINIRDSTSVEKAISRAMKKAVSILNKEYLFSYQLG
jgi:hypothetical protein